jgi:hypothetical protein
LRLVTVALRELRRVDIIQLPMTVDELIPLHDREVEVIYEGLLYRGRLIGADETDLYLVTTAGSFTLPLASISSVRAA